jgi:hypothetical protein
MSLTLKIDIDIDEEQHMKGLYLTMNTRLKPRRAARPLGGRPGSRQFVVGICVVFVYVLAICAQAQTKSSVPKSVPNTVQEKAHMTQHASGTFDVKITPQKPDSDVALAANFGRMTIDKQFHGDLDAISKGEMIGAQTEIKGSAGYVAIERVTGALQGRQGSFVLQHSGTMNRNVPELSVTVVPDSGTGELIGISGRMKIIIAPDGKHSYEFDYKTE